MRGGFGYLVMASCLLQSTVTAQLALTAAPPTCRSVSGQFLVRDDRPAGASDFSRRCQTNPACLLLDPTLLTISCERIKQEVWEKLGFAPPYRGRIFISLRNAESADAEIMIASERFRDGWAYKISMPDLVLRERYLRAMVQVVLWEMANRGIAERGAELPPWLTAGLVRELWSSKGAEIMLPPPQKEVNGLVLRTTNMVIRGEAPLEYARQQLRSHSPLTFEDLSWPKNPEGADEVYELSSQVFLTELLRLNEGRASLHRMVSELPRYLNWQLAFLDAFQEDFEKLVDVEKWWTLRLLRFTSREGSLIWSLTDSLKKVDGALHPAVQVRAAAGESPLETHVTLQTVIQQWQPERQAVALEGCIRELELMRLSMPGKVSMILDRYCEILNGYLAGAKTGGIFHKFRKHNTLEFTKEEVLKELDRLDFEREVLRAAETGATLSLQLN